MNQKRRVCLINKCRKLRYRGYSLGEIASITKLPKTTIYGYIKDISLTSKQKRRIEEHRKLLQRNTPNPRKGRCIPGREISKPKSWSEDLMHIISHFMFDGRIDKSGCMYYSKNKHQISHMVYLTYKIFGIKPICRERNNDVYMLAYYNVELANYIKNKKEIIFDYLKNGTSNKYKKTLLQAFFDDEGSIYYRGSTRRIRGHQKSFFILQKIEELLENFNIYARINKDKTEIEITGRKNLLNFAKEINFSPKIYINPSRKNGIWKTRIQKREILKSAINSYKINS